MSVERDYSEELYITMPIESPDKMMDSTMRVQVRRGLLFMLLAASTNLLVFLFSGAGSSSLEQLAVVTAPLVLLAAAFGASFLEGFLQVSLSVMTGVSFALGCLLILPLVGPGNYSLGLLLAYLLWLYDLSGLPLRIASIVGTLVAYTGCMLSMNEYQDLGGRVADLAVVLIANFMAMYALQDREDRWAKIYQTLHRLRQNGGYDELTGVYSRRQILALAEQALSRSKRANMPLTLLMVDISHLKGLNDSFGQAAGDQVLKSLAQMLAIAVGADDHVGRYDGGRFLILLPQADLRAARRLARRLMNLAGGQSVQYGDRWLSFNISIGMVEARSANVEPSRLVSQVEDALFRAKYSAQDRMAAHVCSDG